MKRPDAGTLLGAIHRHCLECSGGNRKEARNCRIRNCALWPYRAAEQAEGTEKGTGEQLDLFQLTERREERHAG